MAKNVYSVTQINTYIERMFQDDFMLSNLSISGEVSNCKYNHTGHIYFTLKDEKTSISCVMFAGNRPNGLKFEMKDGDEIVVHGYVGVYSVAGKYQVYAKRIELAGVGDLYQRFEALKAALEEKGMFDPMYKKPIPAYATRIGVVTAPTGAAVQDIIRVSKTRNPYVEIILYPAQVQGEAAKGSIISGINCLDEMGLDVIIIGRGGGSIEDLWAFNEEAVAMAVFNARTPIISAVGHETDFTISDFVADKRAATPSQAAELANFRYDDFRASLDRAKLHLDLALENKITNLTNRINIYQKALLAYSPENRIKREEERLKNIYKRLNDLMGNILLKNETRLKVAASHLEGLSPAKKLAAGFGYLSVDGKKVESVEGLAVGDTLMTTISDGTIESKIVNLVKEKNDDGR